MSYLILAEGVSWSWPQAGEQRVGVLIRRPRFFCWRVMPLDGGGKAVSRGQVLLVRSSTTSSSRRQCDGGGGSGLFSDSDSFYQLCQLSALPASILGLSEQTKTGATRGRGRQSRRKPMPQAVLARRPIQYTSRLVFAFF